MQYDLTLEEALSQPEASNLTTRDVTNNYISTLRLRLIHVASTARKHASNLCNDVLGFIHHDTRLVEIFQ